MLPALLRRSRLEPTIYRTQGKHDDVVWKANLAEKGIDSIHVGMYIQPPYIHYVYPQIVVSVS
jgi:hypothetical protein